MVDEAFLLAQKAAWSLHDTSIGTGAISESVYYSYVYSSIDNLFEE